MYQLRAPAPKLIRYIENYWFAAPAPGEPLDLRVDVFVDGRADLIFNFGAPYRREVVGSEAVEHSQSNLDAQRLVPIRITQRGAIRTTGVRFRLGGVAPFAAVPLGEVTGQTPAPSVVFGPDAADLERELATTTDVDQAAQLLDAFFVQRMSTDPTADVFHRALELQVDSDGRINVEELADQLAVSPRHLERLFFRHLGIPPKTVARILRFQCALRALMKDPGCSLAQVATDAGYFDQAHFIKDFKRMSGGVPRGYRGYFPPEGPADFAPNVVVFLQDGIEGTPDDA